MQYLKPVFLEWLGVFSSEVEVVISPMLSDIPRTSGYPAPLAASTHASRFYMMIEILGLDGVIHLTPFFHDQGTVKHQVWADGTMVVLWYKTWLIHWVKAGWPKDFSTEQAKFILDLTSNRGVWFLQVLVISRQASEPENAEVGRSLGVQV